MMLSPQLIRGNFLYHKNPKELTVRQGGCMYAEGGTIRGFVSEEEAAQRIQNGVPCTDFGEKLILPGLVDLHVHAPQYAFRGTGMDLELLAWLNAYTFPEESRYADVDYASRAYRIFVDGLVAGATTRACIFATTHVPATLELMKRLEESGLVTMVGKVNMDRDCPDGLRETADSSVAATEAWLTDCAPFRRTMPMLTPRFVPSCTDELLAQLGRIQRQTHLPVQSHLSENLGEMELVRKVCPTAKHYGDAYERHGLFGGAGCPTVMAHCVHSVPDEVERMAAQGVFVAHCPQSNTNLASGIAPVRDYLNRGLRVGLGTDVAGGSSLSMLRAVTDAVQVSKLRWRLVDESLPPLTFPEALYLATRGGGALFGKVGSLEPDYACDLVVLDDTDLPTARPLPPEERLERLFYLGDDRNVFAKFVAGRRIK